MMDIKGGQKVAGYTLEALLGSGAAGEVWRATDGSDTVAIKFMNAHLLQRPDAKRHRRRMHYEISALMRLREHNVPQVYSFDVDGVRPYVVMAYVPGETYDRLIADGTMLAIDLQKRFKAICAIALTLTRAHHLGIVHRDVKPANIKGFDPPYLLDFGIAMESWEVENARSDIGTGIYMPPAGEPLDRLSDIYGFAIVVYEMLFGQHPLFIPGGAGKTIHETRQHAADLIARDGWRLPSRIAPEDCPDDLKTVDRSQLDALFKRAFGDREHRYLSFAPLLRDLREALASQVESSDAEVAISSRVSTQEHMIAQVEALPQTHYPDPDGIPRRVLIMTAVAVGVAFALICLAVLAFN